MVDELGFDACVDHRAAPDADALRAHTRQNKAFGNQRFRSRIEALIGRSVEVRPRGRPASAPEKCT